MTRTYIDDSRIKHSRGPWHYDESRMNICTAEKCDWVDDDDEDPAYRTVIHTQSAMGGDDTSADLRLLLETATMFDLLNRITGGDNMDAALQEAKVLLEKIAG